MPGNYRPVPGPEEYLRFLAANGYALSAIEQVITGERVVEDLYRELAHYA